MTSMSFGFMMIGVFIGIICSCVFSMMMTHVKKEPELSCFPNYGHGVNNQIKMNQLNRELSELSDLYYELHDYDAIRVTLVGSEGDGTVEVPTKVVLRFLQSQTNTLQDTLRKYRVVKV